MQATFAQTFAEFVGRNWAAIAITLTCLTLVGWFILVLARYVRISLNIFVDTPPPLSMGPVDFKRLEGSHVRFRSFDGVSLRGMWLWASPEITPKGTIIFCHEFGSDMYSCARYLRHLLEAGFSIFTFDFRNHGESQVANFKPLQWCSDKELGDLLGATSYVVTQLAERGLPTDIGLFGISRGAAAAIMAAECDPNVKAICCDSAFSTERVLVGLMKRWAQIFARVRLVYENHPEFFWRLLALSLRLRAQRRMGCKYPSVLKALKRMDRRPILFIHGRKDSYIPVTHARRLLRAAKGPKRLWIVPDAKHNQSAIIRPGQYARRTLAFFETYLTAELQVPAEKPVTSPFPSCTVSAGVK